MSDLDQISMHIGALGSDVKNILTMLENDRRARADRDAQFDKIFGDFQHMQNNLAHKVGLQGEALTRIGGQVRPLEGIERRVKHVEDQVEAIPIIDRRVAKIEKMTTRWRHVFAALWAGVGILASSLAFIADHFGGKIAKWIGLT
jgi:hypothetical protein